MSHITINNIDPNIEQLIRKRAETERKSLSEISYDLIQKALNLDSGSARKMSSSFPTEYKADDEFWQ